MHPNQFLTLTLTTLLTITTTTAAPTTNSQLETREDPTTPALQGQVAKRGSTNTFMYSGDGCSGTGHVIIQDGGSACYPVPENKRSIYTSGKYVSYTSTLPYLIHLPYLTYVITYLFPLIPIPIHVPTLFLTAIISPYFSKVASFIIAVPLYFIFIPLMGHHYPIIPFLILKDVIACKNTSLVSDGLSSLTIGEQKMCSCAIRTWSGTNCQGSSAGVGNGCTTILYGSVSVNC